RNVLCHYAQLSRNCLLRQVGRFQRSLGPPAVHSETVPPGLPPADAEALAQLFVRLLRLRLTSVWRIPPEGDPLGGWFHRYRPGRRLLSGFRRCAWPGHAPRFSVILVAQDEAPAWLRESLRSVTGQTYPHWELLCA